MRRLIDRLYPPGSAARHDILLMLTIGGLFITFMMASFGGLALANGTNNIVLVVLGFIIWLVAAGAMVSLIFMRLWIDWGRPLVRWVKKRREKETS